MTDKQMDAIKGSLLVFIDAAELLKDAKNLTHSQKLLLESNIFFSRMALSQELPVENKS